MSAAVPLGNRFVVSGVAVNADGSVDFGEQTEGTAWIESILAIENAARSKGREIGNESVADGIFEFVQIVTGSGLYGVPKSYETTFRYEMVQRFMTELDALIWETDALKLREDRAQRQTQMKQTREARPDVFKSADDIKDRNAKWADRWSALRRDPDEHRSKDDLAMYVTKFTRDKARKAIQDGLRTRERIAEWPTKQDIPART